MKALLLRIKLFFALIKKRRELKEEIKKRRELKEEDPYIYK